MRGNNDDEPWDEDCHDDDYYSDDNASSGCDSDTESCYTILHDIVSQELAAIPRPVHVWKNLKIGETIIQVSNQGYIKPYKSLYASTLGCIVPGTPYRSYPVEYDRGDVREYYVHELVWWAFQGTVPKGWVVRHKPSYVSIGARKLYSNALCHLDIFPDTMTRVVS